MSNQTILPTIQTNYLLAAINDTQAVIRQIDTKLGILMTIFAIPLTKLGVIYAKCALTIKTNTGCMSSLCVILTAIFVVSWIIGFIAAFRGLVGIDNPSEHVSGIKPKGTFYGGGLFKPMGFADIFFNDHKQPEKPLDQQFSELPATIEDIHKELIFEQAKIVYIRSVKLHRMKHAFMFGFVWLSAGFSIWIINLATQKVSHGK